MKRAALLPTYIYMKKFIIIQLECPSIISVILVTSDANAKLNFPYVKWDSSLGGFKVTFLMFLCILTI